MAETDTQTAAEAQGQTQVLEPGGFAALLQQEFKPRTDRAREAVESAVSTLAAQALEQTALISDDAVRSIESMIAEIDRTLAKAVLRSPRFETSSDGLRIQVDGGRICLFGRTGGAWGCSEAGLEEDETGRSHVQRVVDSFHQAIFSPRIDLSRIDINSLDGSNRVTRNPLDLLLEP